jgi:Ras-related protein Rab-1A
MESNYDKLFKILLIGDSGVGKSSLLYRYCDDKFDNTYISTIGVDFKFKTIEHNDKIYKFQIWDTAGQERFRSVTSSYYRGAYSIILVYDITDKDSFLNLSKWIEEVNHHGVPGTEITIVGNKIDCNIYRQVQSEDVVRFAKDNGCKCFETSAKTGFQVETIFKSLLPTLITNDDLKNEQKNININSKPVDKSCCY